MSNNYNYGLENIMSYNDSIDYDKVLSDNESFLIESYIEQYGEQYRNLIISRYKKIKYCFFRPFCNDESYPEIVKPFFLDEIHFELGMNLTIECLKELGLDDLIVYTDRVGALSNESKQILKYLFEPYNPITNMNCNDLCLEELGILEKRQLEMWLEKSIEEITNILKRYKKKYKEICQYNNDKYKLSSHAQELIKQGRIDSNILREYIVNGFEPTQFEYSKSIISQFNNPFVIASTKMERATTGIYSPVVYIPINAKIRDYFDIILDHEIRHGIEMVQIDGKRKDEYYVKSGLSLLTFVNEKIVNKELDFLNEIMTQKMTIENTHKRYKNGQFIFTPKGLVVSYHTTGYDKYIPIFDELIDKDLYEILLAARMDQSLDNLYDKVPQKTLIKLENNIREGIKKF